MANKPKTSEKQGAKHMKEPLKKHGDKMDLRKLGAGKRSERHPKLEEPANRRPQHWNQRSRGALAALRRYILHSYA